MEGTLSKPGCFTTVLMVGLLLGVVFPASTVAHETTCDVGTTVSFILLPNLASDQGSVAEYVQFSVLHRTPLEDKAFDARNDIDAHIEDLGCHASGFTFDLTGSDGGEDLYKLQVRFYNHQGFEIGETDCQQAAFDDEPIEETTQYVVVVSCDGGPVDTHSAPVPQPYTVRADLTINT